MGSSEFDLGFGIATALEKMRENKSMEAYALNVFGPPEFTWEIENSFHEWEDHRAIKNKHLLDATLFVITPKMLRPHVDELLHLLAFGEEHLKQRSLLRNTLFCSPDWKTDPYEEICGWLEMDNGFMFFSDPQMWMDFCAYFKVQIPETFTFVHTDFSKVNEDLELAPRKSA